jgi:6-pyruvoyl-tetrahydropterin synthase
MEVAHRLYETKGKCEAIHGHSMLVTLTIEGEINSKGILFNEGNPDGFEFGAVKKRFREYLDTFYDHHLLLNRTDPFAGPLYEGGEAWEDGRSLYLPGLQSVPGDPTTEHLSLWIAQWSSQAFAADVDVDVWETEVNNAMTSWKFSYSLESSIPGLITPIRYEVR